MEILINDKNYKIIVTKKKIKHAYIKVLEDFTISLVIPNHGFFNNPKDIIKNNIKAVTTMILKQEKKQQFDNDFHYLGKTYDIIKTNILSYQIGETKIFINSDLDINYFYLEEAKKIFKERLIYNYNLFTQVIPFPSLKIRTMKTRYGVCNIKSKTITLNLNLIKTDIKYLDYVIIHELAHFIYPNHQKDFWNLVGDNCVSYKEIRYLMRNS